MTKERKEEKKKKKNQKFILWEDLTSKHPVEAMYSNDKIYYVKSTTKDILMYRDMVV